MATNQKLIANRTNALKSTGPRSIEGKVVSSRNAIRHGLLSRAVLLTDENAGELVELRTALEGELHSEGILEGLLVDRIVSAFWRLRRLARVEAGLFDIGYFEAVYQRALTVGGSYDAAGFDLGSLAQEPTPITDSRTIKNHAAAERQKTRAHSMKYSDSTLLAHSFLQDSKEAEAFGKLSRYEVTIERSLYRALHELQRLQAARAGVAIPPPVAVDVTVSREGNEG